MPAVLDADVAAPPSPPSPLPVGVGLAIGAVASLSLWAAIVATVAGLLG